MKKMWKFWYTLCCIKQSEKCIFCSSQKWFLCTVLSFTILFCWHACKIEQIYKFNQRAYGKLIVRWGGFWCCAFQRANNLTRASTNIKKFHFLSQIWRNHKSESNTQWNVISPKQVCEQLQVCVYVDLTGLAFFVCATERAQRPENAFKKSSPQRTCVRERERRSTRPMRSQLLIISSNLCGQ